MSSILVDNLTGKTTAGSVTVTSEHGGATMQLQQGLCKAWFNLNAIGTEAYRDTFNIDSVTDNATGDFSHNFTNSMNNSNHVAILGTNGTDNTTGVNSFATYFDPTSTGTGFTRSQNISQGGTPLDTGFVLGVVVGDLA